MGLVGLAGIRRGIWRTACQSGNDRRTQHYGEKILMEDQDTAHTLVKSVGNGALSYKQLLKKNSEICMDQYAFY
jgi:hypothetical protein